MTSVRLPQLQAASGDGPVVDVDVDDVQDPAWRANELRKRVNARREYARTAAVLAADKKKRLANKHMLAVAQRWKDAKIREQSQIKQGIMAFEKNSMKFLERADQQWSLDIKLRALDRSVTSSATAVRHAIMLLERSETRLLQAKTKIARPAQPKLSVLERIEQEITSLRPRQPAPEQDHAGKSTESRQGSKNGSAINPPVGTRPLVVESEPDELEIARCRVCHKRVLASILTEHEEACELGRRNERRVRYPRPITTHGSQPMDTCMVPQCPRNVRVGQVTHGSIELLWDPPIFDGGTHIAQYEIDMDFTNKKRVGKRVKREYVRLEPIQTNRWCTPVPVAHQGFVIRGLEAATEYAHIRVYAVNGVGRSLSAPEISVCGTLPAVPPSVPLFLRAVDATSRTVSIEWRSPLDCGGGNPEQLAYEVAFTHTYIMPNSVSKAVSRARKRSIVTAEVGTCKFTIDGLLGDDKIAEIAVRAININGRRLTGDYSNSIPEVFTLPTDAVQDLEEEIQRIELIDSEFVDTSFYQGFAQQFTKVRALQLLQELRTERQREAQEEEERERKRLQRGAMVTDQGSKAEPLPNREADLAASMPSRPQEQGSPSPMLPEGKDAADVANEDAGIYESIKRQQESQETSKQRANRLAKERAMKRYHTREDQFQWKLHQLRERIVKLKATRDRLLHKRHGVTYMLKGLSQRVKLVRPELDRADNFRGPFMDSSVMHGEAQRFDTPGLRLSLLRELHDNLRKMAQAKQETIALEKETAAVEEQIANLEEQLEERIAAHTAFENEHKRLERAREKLLRWQETGQRQFFARWCDFVHARKADRQIVGRFFQRFQNRELYMGWNQWRAVLRNHDRMAELGKEDAHPGAGSKALVKAGEFRTELQHEVELVLQSIATTGAQLDDTKRTSSQREELKSSEAYESEYAPHLKPDESALDMAPYYQGMQYERDGEWERALKCYHDYSDRMKELENLQQMSVAWRRMGSVYSSKKEPEKAYIHFDRSLQLAREARSTSGVGHALVGLGRSLASQAQHRAALRYFDRAVHYFRATKDRLNEAMCYRASQDAYAGMNNHEGRDHYKGLADEIEFKSQQTVKRVSAAIDDLSQRLIGATASSTDPVPLERVSGLIPRLRRTIKDTQKTLTKQEKKIERLEKKVTEDTLELERLRKQQVQANQTEAAHFDAIGPHGSLQRFPLFQFRDFVKVAQEKCQERIDGYERKLRRLRVRRSNAQDDLNELYLQLDVENGGLMKRSMQRDSFRCMSLNPANAAGNDVLGDATGGFNRFAAAAGLRWFAYDMYGTCHHTVGGDREGAHLGELNSHTKRITCICFYDRRVYTGSVDCTVRVWEIDENECLGTLKGHRSSVATISASGFKVITASSDLTLRVWSTTAPFECEYVVKKAHLRSVLALHLPSGPEFATGGGDYELKIWRMPLPGNQQVMSPRGRSRQRVRCRISLLGHACAVTAVRLSAAECISGGADGRLIIWAVDDGARLRVMDAHSASVLCIRFDAVKIISGGADRSVQTHDIATGAKLQTLHGHKAPIVDLDFDTTKIVSLSLDGVLRKWPFRGFEHRVEQIKQHILEPGETLPKLAKRYSTTVQKLREWNNIDQPRDLYLGMRLLVQKGPSLNDARLEQSPTRDQHMPRLRGVDRVPIGERHMLNLSPERVQELARAGTQAIGALQDVANHFAHGSPVNTRIGEMQVMAAATTSAGMASSTR